MSHLSGLPEDQDEPRVVLERTIRLVEAEMAGAPQEQVLERLRSELPDDLDVPEQNLRAAAGAIAEGRREDGSKG